MYIEMISTEQRSAVRKFYTFLTILILILTWTTYYGVQVGIFESEHHVPPCIGENLCVNIDKIKEHVKKMTLLGQRGFGSINLDQSIDYFKTQLEGIKLNSDNNGRVIQLHHDGEFQFNYGIQNRSIVYRNITNLMYVFGDQSKYNNKNNGSLIKSFLFNCHLDTVITSPGASDNALNCAIMLEVIRLLSDITTVVGSIPKPLLSNTQMMFLFNGAEERGLVGAKSFLNSSTFKNANIQGIVNLDASSSAFRDFMFRTTINDSWMLYLYKQVVQFPLSTVLAEEIYSTGIIPSGTDFAIFESFTNISILDIAFVGNGYYYHTTRDTLEEITDSSIFKATKNIANLAYHLYIIEQDVDDIYTNANKGNYKRLVYFDFLGLHMFIIPYKIYKMIVVMVIFIVIVRCYFYNKYMKNGGTTIWYQKGRFITIICVSMIISYMNALFLNILLALSFKLIHSNMLWISNFRLLAFIYAVPFSMLYLVSFEYITITWLPLYARNHELKISTTDISHNTLVAVLLLICLWNGIRSSYILLLIILPNILSCIGLYICQRTYLWHQNLFGKSDHVFHWRHVEPLINGIFLIPIIAYFLYIFDYLMIVMLPITGRIPSYLNSEIYFAILMSICTTIITFTCTPFLVRIQNYINIHIKILTTVSVVIFGYIVLASSIGYMTAFSWDFPKRYYLTHVNVNYMEVFNGSIVNNSYLCGVSMDNRYMSDLPQNITNRFQPIQYMESYLYPRIFHLNIMSPLVADNRLMKIDSPHGFNRNFSAAMKSRSCVERMCKYELTINGGDRGIIDIQLTLNQGSILLGSSINFNVSQTFLNNTLTKLYNVILYKGTQETFTFDFIVLLDKYNDTNYISASIDSNSVVITEEIKRITSQLPSYINTLTMVTTLYIFGL